MAHLFFYESVNLPFEFFKGHYDAELDKAV